MNTLALRKETIVNLFYFFVFIYFITLSADLLNVQVVLYKAKLGHLLAAFLFACLFLQRKALNIPKETLFPFCAIFFSLILSFLLSAPEAGVKIRCLGYLFIYLFYFVCYFILPYNLITLLDREKVARLYFLSFTCVGIYALYQMVLSLFGIEELFITQMYGAIVRPQALCYEPSYYALYMVPFVMFYNALFFLRPAQSLWKLIGVNLLLIISTSTSAFFAYFIFFALAWALSCLKRIREQFPRFRRKLFLVAASIGSLFLLAFLFFKELVLQSFFKFFHTGFMEHHSFFDRWNSIVECFKLFLEHPLFGVGLGGISPHLYQERFSNLQGALLKDISFFDPSNICMELLASLGIVGALCFIPLGRLAWKTWKQADRSDTTYALALSFLTMLIVLQFNQGMFRSYVWVHAAIAFSFLRSTRTGWAEKE